jgi:hypothetical protein
MTVLVAQSIHAKATNALPCMSQDPQQQPARLGPANSLIAVLLWMFSASMQTVFSSNALMVVFLN